MTQSRLYRTSIALLLTGVASVLAWVWLLGRAGAAPEWSLRPWYVLLLFGITAACVLLRFSRWQFILRRTEVRVPARRSLSIYLASLAGIATPAYVGELSRAVLVRRESKGSIKAPLAVVVFERLIDAAALATLGAVMVQGRRTFLIMLAVLVLVGLLASQGYRFVRRGSGQYVFLRGVAQPRRFAGRRSRGALRLPSSAG